MEDRSSESRKFYEAPLEALGLRAAFLGLTGDLLPTKALAKEELAKCGYVGRQILNKMSQMEGDGWVIGNRFLHLPEPRRGWQSVVIPGELKTPVYKALGTVISTAVMAVQKPLLVGRMGGFNNDDLRLIDYNGTGYGLKALLDGSAWTGSSKQEIATIVAHEVSHNDGILKSFQLTEQQKFSLEERATLAKRLLITEARAHVVHAAIAEKLNLSTPIAISPKRALRDGNLGAYLWKNYSRPGGFTYESLQTLTAKEANDTVSQYFEKHFPEGLIDRRTGKFKNFDISAGLDEQIGTTRFDEKLAARMAKSCNVKLGLVGATLEKVVSSGAFVRGTQALGGLGAFVATAHLADEFKRGQADGVSALARSNVSYLGYQLGSLFLAKACEHPGLRLSGAVLAKVRFLGALTGGALGANGADWLYGSPIDASIKYLFKYGLPHLPKRHCFT